MAKPDYIASDAHLGAVSPDRERAFLHFLEHVGSAAGSLLINGDLFDFWFEYGEVIPGRHFRVLAALAEIVDAGVAVTMVGGNHDAWGGKFLREQVGIDYRNGLIELMLGGRRALIAHGDGLGTGDVRYRVLKALVRSPLVIGAFRAIHPEVGLRIARAVSRTEHRQDHNDMLSRARFLEQWGKTQLQTNPALHYVVCGHAHLPSLVEVSSGRYYINAGDWVQHNSYAVVRHDAEPRLLHWPELP